MDPNFEPNFEHDNKRVTNPEEIVTPEEKIEKVNKHLRLMEEDLRGAEEEIEEVIGELERLKKDTDSGDTEDLGYAHEKKEINKEIKNAEQRLADLGQLKSDLIQYQERLEGIITNWEETRELRRMRLLGLDPNRKN
jgi:chromosome segregation ATPase